MLFFINPDGTVIAINPETGEAAVFGEENEGHEPDDCSLCQPELYATARVGECPMCELTGSEDHQ